MKSIKRSAARRLVGAASSLMLLSCLAACGNSGNTASEGGEFDAETFFRGKTITVIANSPAGVSSDVYVRMIAKDLGSYIPGNPEVIVTNVDGLPGIEEVYDAPEDRLIVGSASDARQIYSFALDQAATYDPTKMKVVGAMDPTPRGIVYANDVLKAYPNGIPDAIGKSEPPFIFAEEVSDASTVLGFPFLASWLCETFTIPCKMEKVADASSNAIQASLKRGDFNTHETHFAAIFQRYNDDLQSGNVKMLVTYGEPSAAEFGTPYDLPNIMDLLQTDESKAEFEDKILPLIGSGGLAVPLFVGPNFPDEARTAIAAAFEKQFAENPDLLAETTQARMGDISGIEYTPVAIGADEAQGVFEEYMNAFNANQDFYNEKAQEYFDKYWK